MRRATLTAIVLAGVGLMAARQIAAQVPQPPVGQLQKIRNNLFMIAGQGGNTAVFVTRTGVVLVDTKLSGNGQAILDRVQAVSDLPVTTIINTHAHADHTGSNDFFSASVDVVTHENTRAHMLNDPALRDMPQALPDRTFRDRLTIGRGQDEVDLYYFGKGHTDGDALVVFPAVRAMHAGDLFAWTAAPIVDADNGGSGVAYPVTLEKAIATIHNVDTVIPGHAAVTTWLGFVEFAEFTRELVKAAQSARSRKQTAEQAAASLEVPAKFHDYVADAPLPGLEPLGTNLARARENVVQIFNELK